MSDDVNHPTHYACYDPETIDLIEQRASSADLPAVELGNWWQVLKYIDRWPHKDQELKDLKKARWYLDRLISHVEERCNA